MLTVNKAVYFDANQSNVKTPKTKPEPALFPPIPDMILPILKSRRAASMMVCPSTSGEMLTQIAFKRAWESYLHYLNLQQVAAIKAR